MSKVIIKNKFATSDYEILDKYIRTGICENEDIKQKINKMHEKNKFKLRLMDSFKYQ